MPNKKLCMNPKCRSHCDITGHGANWKFSNGFQMPLTKAQLKNFDEDDDYNLCSSCEGFFKLLGSLNLLKYGK